MWTLVNDLEAAFSLFETCIVNLRTLEVLRDDRARRIYNSWQLMAARDGAMTIYHFGKAMEGIKSTVATAPTLASFVSRDKLRSATKMFRAYFPNYERIRHGIAHMTELSADLSDFNKNAFQGTYDGPGIKTTGRTTMIHNGLQDRLYTITHKGAIFTYEVSGDTLIKLIEVKNEFYSAFPETDPFDGRR